MAVRKLLVVSRLAATELVAVGMERLVPCRIHHALRERCDSRHQLSWIDRLRKVKLEAALQRPCPIFGACISGHRRRRNLTDPLVLVTANFTYQLKPVHPRHPEISHEDVRRRARNEIEY